MRSKVKAMSYGLAYGLSAFGLSKQLTISTGEAQGLMDEYFARFGGVRDYLREVVAEARATGYTATMLGRRRYLPDLTSDNRQRREGAERMALNAPIQGSAADIIKLAMKGVDAALTAEGHASRILLQVHDELVLEVAPGEREAVEALVRREMGAAVDDGRAARRQRGGRSELARRRALGTAHGRVRATLGHGSTVVRDPSPLVRPGDAHEHGEQHRVDAEDEQQQGVPGGHEGARRTGRRPALPRSTTPHAGARGRGRSARAAGSSR